MGVFKKCKVTGRMHNTPKKRCRKCEAKRMRKFMRTKSGKEYAKKRSEKQRNTTQKFAYSKVYYAIYSGKIKHPSKLKCLDCGIRAEVYDHRDYLKPLEIEPVCKVCNFKRGPGKNNLKRSNI